MLAFRHHALSLFKFKATLLFQINLFQNLIFCSSSLFSSFCSNFSLSNYNFIFSLFLFFNKKLYRACGTTYESLRACVCLNKTGPVGRSKLSWGGGVKINVSSGQSHQHVFEKLLRVQMIPKAQRGSIVISVFLRFWDLHL